MLIFIPYMQKDIPSEEIKTGEEDDDDNGDNLLKDSNDSEFELLLILGHICHLSNQYQLFIFSFISICFQHQG